MSEALDRLTDEPAPKRPQSTSRVTVVTVEDGTRRRHGDRVATEEPMEIRVEGPGMEQRNVAVTMRTPGNDFELAVGFLHTEGMISGAGDVATVRYCAVPREEQHYNVVSVAVTRALDVLPERNFYATSSCGICGKASLEAIEVRCAPVADGLTVTPEAVIGMPDALRAAQRVFERTGGLHAAALFQPSGELVEVREDVGRHNAVDKLVGSELLAGRLPLSDRVMMVSGRTSFEIVQKAATAGIPVVCAVSAPSSLAVDAARSFGITLIGFLRGTRFNVYTRPDRVEWIAPDLRISGE
ncbi:MAG: formate dehydrogenase accessory sulfurtransferase FdhD [Gaiellales bacterium]